MKDFKVRCVNLNYCNSSCYDVNGVYEVKNGYLIDKTGAKLGPGNFITIDYVNKFSSSTFELVTEPQQFTKDMLKTGMWVECRNGEKAIVLLNTDNGDIVSGDTWFPLRELNQNLMYHNKFSCHQDIVKVYQPLFNRGFYTFNEKSSKLLWQRPVPKMTHEEIAEKLGHEFEYVKE